MHRSRVYAVAFGLLVCTLTGCAARQSGSLTQEQTPPCSRQWSPECWAGVVQGMTKHQVQTLLGRPDRKSLTGSSELWIYDGKYVVWFDESGQVSGTTER